MQTQDSQAFPGSPSAASLHEVGSSESVSAEPIGGLRKAESPGLLCSLGICISLLCKLSQTLATVRWNKRKLYPAGNLQRQPGEDSALSLGSQQARPHQQGPRLPPSPEAPDIGWRWSNLSGAALAPMWVQAIPGNIVGVERGRPRRETTYRGVGCL